MSLKNLYLNILFSSNSSILAHAKHKKQQPIQIKRSAPEWSTGVCALFFASFSLVCLLIVFLFALARQFSFNRSLNKLTFCSAPHACQIQFYSFSLSFFWILIRHLSEYNSEPAKWMKKISFSTTSWSLLLLFSAGPNPQILYVNCVFSFRSISSLFAFVVAFGQCQEQWETFQEKKSLENVCCHWNHRTCHCCAADFAPMNNNKQFR